MRHSVRRRFATALTANLLRASFSFASGIILARGLGASDYGDLSFLLGTFVAIGHLLDMGTASGFYTFIARQRQPRKLIVSYLAWVGVQFFATALLVGLLLPQPVIARIWVGHQREIVVLALCASFLTTQAWGLISQLGEALRRTVLIQSVALGQASVHLGAIAIASYWDWLSPRAVLWLLIVEYVALVATLGPKLIRSNMADPSDGEGAATVGDFVSYCAPLAVYGWAAFVYGFADHWMLQRFGGPEQQGFFAVARQFANVSLIATMSMMAIFWKEVAEAHALQNRERVRMLYFKVSRGLFMVGAVLAGFAIPWSETILVLLLGNTYAAAWPALAIMFLYPVHQSMGQVCGTMLLSVGRTRLYVLQSIGVMLVSLPVTYFVLAPGSAILPGLGLGAQGIALKMVVLNAIGVNVLLVMIARLYELSYGWGHQVIALIAPVVLGFAAHRVVTWLLPASGEGAIHALPRMLAAGVLYLPMVAGLVWIAPWLVGLDRHELRALLRRGGWITATMAD